MLNAHASFASFVVGSSNRLAATAAKAVAEAPGAMYNPLFIYARPGLGKTHLLMAIGNEAKRFEAARTVEYVTVDDFVEAYQAALAAGQAEAYRRRFTEADLVLLDDAQLLADRRELQSELLRLIDILTAADRQIVLAGDRPPEEIQQLDERLIRRFAGGLVIDIGAPDYETRLAIIARRAQERQTAFIPAVLDAVAQLPITTVRELLGALNRLIAQQAVQSEPLTAEQAHQVLEALGHRPEGDPGPGYAPEVRAAVRDEFTDFLSDLTVSVAQRVDRWRQQLTEATMRWGGEGFRTTRLDTLLAGDLTEDPAEALFEFEQNIVRLRELHVELEGFAPELLSESTLHDPDRIEEAERFVVDAREAGPPLPGPLPRFTLEVFTAGPSTRPAVEAIRTAAAAPGQRYNPLVIVGRPGSGKSHLLHAFGHALRAGGLPRVAVLDGRQFVSDLSGESTPSCSTMSVRSPGRNGVRRSCTCSTICCSSRGDRWRSPASRHRRRCRASRHGWPPGCPADSWSSSVFPIVRPSSAKSSACSAPPRSTRNWSIISPRVPPPHSVRCSSWSRDS